MNEQISALMDGELDEQEATLVFAHLRRNEGARRDWAEFHLIRDALRDAPGLHADLTDRVLEQLLEEPVVLAPRAAKAMSWRQNALAMAASVAGVAVVSAVMFGGRAPVAGQIAKGAAPSSQVAANDMQEYLIAHQSHTPSSSMQGASRYIKTVSVDNLAMAKTGTR